MREDWRSAEETADFSSDSRQDQRCSCTGRQSNQDRFPVTKLPESDILQHRRTTASVPYVYNSEQAGLLYVPYVPKPFLYADELNVKLLKPFPCFSLFVVKRTSWVRANLNVLQLTSSVFTLCVLAATCFQRKPSRSSTCQGCFAKGT